MVTIRFHFGHGHAILLEVVGRYDRSRLVAMTAQVGPDDRQVDVSALGGGRQL